MGINSEKKYAKVTMKFLSVWWCLCGFIPYWFCFLPKFSLISTCYAYNQKCGGSLRKQLILFPFANLCECQTKWKMGELPTWDEPAQIWMKQPFAGSWRRKTPILPLKKKKIIFIWYNCKNTQELQNQYKEYLYSCPQLTYC